MKWYKSNPERLAIEKRLLAQYYPGSKLIIKHGEMKVVKRLITLKNTYLIEGVFEDNHPYAAMRFYVRQPRLKNLPKHMYSTKELCLHDPDDVGPETTAKVYLDWAIQWIHFYERWLDGEEWPETNYG